MEKILIPTDFSPCAEHAVKLGIQIASEINAEIIFTYVSPVPAGGDVTFFVDAPLIEERKLNATKKFQDMISKYLDLIHTPYDFKFDIGFPAQVITEIAEESEASIIILGTKGATNRIEQILGSTTYDIIKLTTCPVLAVPEISSVTGFKKIALATDFKTEIDYDIIDVLTLIAKTMSSEIHIITLTNDQEPQTIQMNREQMDLWTESLEGIPHYFHFIKNGDVEKGILKYAKENNIDMIAVMPSRLSFISNLFHRSVSKGLAYHSHLPLLV